MAWRRTPGKAETKRRLSCIQLQAPFKVTLRMKVQNTNTVKLATITGRERINAFLNVQLLLKQIQNFKCPNSSFD